MSDQEGPNQTPVEQVDLENGDSRREFINKLVAAAGTLAVAGLLSGTDEATAAAKKAWNAPTTTQHKVDGATQMFKMDGATQAIKIDGAAQMSKIEGVTSTGSLNGQAAQLSVHKLGAAGPRTVGHGAGVGFVINLSGRALGEALVQAGLLPHDANLDNAKLTIEFSA